MAVRSNKYLSSDNLASRYSSKRVSDPTTHRSTTLLLSQGGAHSRHQQQINPEKAPESATLREEDEEKASSRDGEDPENATSFDQLQ
jgi:hypothetical protein